ncbi:MAG: hypothetical protein V1734_06265 [Nanoarchaeota archaeon]
MGLFSSFRKKEDVVKLAEEKKLVLRMFTLFDEADVMDTANHLKMGTTIALFKVKNHSLLKSALSSLKKACTEVNGDIVGLPDGWFVAVPSAIQIVKANVNAGKQIAASMMEKEAQAKEENAHLADKITYLDEIDTN